MQWLDNAFQGKIQASYNREEAVIIDTEIDKLMNSTRILTPDNYVDQVFEEGIDAIVLYYSTDAIAEHARNIAF